MSINLSVVCPVYNEEKFISSCIESILDQDYPKEELEVLIVDGMSTDKTREIIYDFCKKQPFIKLLVNPDKVVPFALNKGIKASKGKVIIRIDAHSNYPKDYFSRLTNELEKLDADNVGGVWKTLPANDTILCKSIAIGASHKFGIGNSLHKIGADSIIETDTVPFGCFNRKIFDKIGFFDTDLIRNQDDEFNARIIKNGGKIYLIPGVVIEYYARDKISKLSTMFYQYGLFKPLVNKKLGTPATTRQFFPLLFVLGIIFGLILSFIWSKLFIIYFSVLLLYLSLSFYFSIKIAIKEKVAKYLIFLPIIFFVIHFSYGLGYLIGIFKFIIFNKKKINISINR